MHDGRSKGGGAGAGGLVDRGMALFQESRASVVEMYKANSTATKLGALLMLLGVLILIAGGGGGGFVDISVGVEGCPYAGDTQTWAHSCQQQWTGDLHGRGRGGATGPFTAMLPPAVVAAYGGFSGGGASSPSLAECHGGALLLAFVTGGQGGNLAAIATARLPRKAKRWSLPTVVSHGGVLSARGGVLNSAAGQPLLTRDPSSKRVKLFHDIAAGGGGGGWVSQEVNYMQGQTFSSAEAPSARRAVWLCRLNQS